MKTNLHPVSMVLALLVVAVCLQSTHAQALKPLETGSQKKKQGDVESALNNVTKKYDRNAEFLLKYKFKKGDVLRWKVDHSTKNDTKVRKQTSTSTSRSLSTMQWRITNVDSLGHYTVEMSVLDADMRQQVDEKPEIAYNSKSHRGQVPPIFERFAEGIGVPIATYQISPQGRVQDKKEIYRTIKFGVGNITMPVPEIPVKIGTAWNSPSGITISRPDGSFLQVQTRVQYRLQAVENGIATVSFNTHVLTPVDDPKIRSQLVQQLSRGVIQFDIDKGMMISKKLVWKESVVGFMGPESNLDYLAKYDITLDQSADSKVVIKDQGVNKEGLQKFIRLSEDAPIFRW